VREVHVRVREFLREIVFRLRELRVRVREGCDARSSVRENRENYKRQTSTLCPGYAVWKEDWSLELKGKWIQARNKGGNTPTLLDNEIFYASSCNLSFNHDLLDP
jgi:hypothetical protein